jgi:hypothetical protein
MKVCTTCKTSKEIDQFWKHTGTKDGLRPSCKDCIRQQNSTHYFTNKPAYRLRDKLWRKENPEKSKQIFKKHSKSERGRKTLLIWRQNNLIKLRKYNRIWMKNRLKDPIFRLSKNISRRIRYYLTHGKNKQHWEPLVGYSIDTLKTHLETQFRNGMSWDNYGKWHIDHIKPISKFKITDVHCQEFKECWALSNLQPLWATDNIKKGASIIISL